MNKTTHFQQLQRYSASHAPVLATYSITMQVHWGSGVRSLVRKFRHKVWPNKIRRYQYRDQEFAETKVPGRLRNWLVGQKLHDMNKDSELP